MGIAASAELYYAKNVLNNGEKLTTINVLDNFDKKSKSIITLNFLFGLFNIIIQ